MSNSYIKILERGRNHLLRFKEDKEYSGITGIEESLVQPYLNQIIELNNYIYTTASTNYPDEFIQPMFICGAIHKSLITKEFLEELNKNKYSYWICSYVNKFEMKYENNIKDSIERQILFNILRRLWIFDDENA